MVKKEVLIGAGFKEEERKFVEKWDRTEDVYDTLSRYGMIIEWIDQVQLKKGTKLDYLVYPTNSELQGIIDVNDSPDKDSKYYEAFEEASNESMPLVTFKATIDAKCVGKLKLLK